MRRRIRFVDVFGGAPMMGNGLAVVVDSEGLTDREMLETTRWLNLSETTFLLPPKDPQADYRVRIFTLSGELPFAGHPTLGTCHVWLETTGSSSDEIVQECGVGLVPLRRLDGSVSFQAPPTTRSGQVDEAFVAGIAEVLGVASDEIVDASWVDNGPGWVAIQLADAESVLSVDPDYSRHPDPNGLFIGLFGFHQPGSEALYEVRAFFPDPNGRMLEDPVTGSLNASLAQWLIAAKKATPPYVASQGAALGRSGRVHISSDESGAIWVAGSTITLIDGHIDV